MGTNNGSQIAGIAQSKIQLNLNDRSMTWLHSAGMAGLWMTLKQLEEQFPTAAQRVGQLNWSLSSQSISLNWSGCDLDVLNWLLEQSFQINHEGLISLTGLRPQTLSIDTQIAIHQGITATFLQHSRFYKSDAIKLLKLTIAEKTISVSYKRITAYAHQEFARYLCDKQGQLLQQPLHIASWLYPGAMVSHAMFHDRTKFEVTVEEALVLLFAPVACWYFRVPPDKFDEQVQDVLVIPAVYDLAVYAECDWKIRDSSYEKFWAASLTDAGLRLLSIQEETGLATNHGIRQCQSILFGRAKWVSQQMVRKKVEIVEATEEMLSYYQLSSRSFLGNIVYESNRESYHVVSKIPGRITDNLAKGLPWWLNLGDLLDSSKLINKVNFEQEGLLKMLEQTQWDDQSKILSLFIEACHEALRRIYAKLYERTPEDEYAPIERFNIRIRSELGRCKNAIALRRLMSNFFAEAGQIPTLQEHWKDLLPITTGEVDWQLTRDLILLALASYKKTEASKRDENSKLQGLENSQIDQETLDEV